MVLLKALAAKLNIAKASAYITILATLVGLFMSLKAHYIEVGYQKAEQEITAAKEEEFKEYRVKIAALHTAYQQQIEEAEAQVRVETVIDEKVIYVDREVEKIVVVDVCDDLANDVIGLLLESSAIASATSNTPTRISSEDNAHN